MKHTKGFTLIEVLVAMAIYVIVISIVAVSLSNMLKTTDASLKSIIRFNKLQRAVIDMQRDFIQVVGRPIIDEYNTDQPAVFSSYVNNGNILNFSTRIGSNPLRSDVKSDIRRVAYRYQDGKLYRMVWPVLDRLNSQVSERLILDGITDLNWQYIGSDQITYDSWPPSSNRIDELPAAIKLDLTLSKDGTVSKIFLIKG